jgi:hypothetical protein
MWLIDYLSAPFPKLLWSPPFITTQSVGSLGMTMKDFLWHMECHYTFDFIEPQ